ncbi:MULTISPECIES: CRISPR-associated endoribonuclease Cas6 [Clostridium]|uniref:CRISPR-associated endoribonuclease Cas6 n=1 Tax=Clostridium TaxID=1485 RepID=UPI0013E96DD7|nr:MULTISPECIES: CRISPR-associated endoribonuclease Cas6 [Clostridium]MBW9158407.1 CRISPR-associated endoribonuclease Cas6 [Clostridium tagluense]MBZ9634178.1 CRISPR-associated endoribonuclease Cas6 [Clostridium sp. FP1]WLC66912.1 CRISPR-associated endoribonuclease Cas6 [Clostridium tagluense]
MEYAGLTITACLLQDVYFTKAGEVIGQVINKASYMDNQLAEKHVRNEYKNYCFDLLYPLESDKTYKRGRIYVFRIRSLEENFIVKLKLLLPKVQSDFMKIIAIEQNNIKQKHIIELYTVTPALVTVDNKHWLPQDNFMLLQQRFQMNLEKKYKAYYGEALNVKQSFIQHIEILNHKPMSFFYKNTKLLANKFKIIPNDDIISQKLAFVAEATGIGEKSSAAGLGYCNAQYLK